MIKKFYKIGKKLFPLCRSITGRDTLKTLKIIQKEFKNLKIRSIKSGTKVFDWTIPPVWNVHNAFILDKYKKKIIDFKKNNLHLISYSEPINRKLSKNEILKKIYTIPKQSNAIPYITSYYKRNWGFCDTHKNKKKIEKKYKDNDSFSAVIKTSFKKNGYMNYGELFLNGKYKDELLISTYICHPSMANNELSGPIVSMALINYFKKKKLNYGLRFIFIPETIGSIAYISQNFKKLKKLCLGGLNLTCLGGSGNLSIIYSKYNDSSIDRTLNETLKEKKINHKIFSFLERGSDERQFNSPGIEIPMAMISRDKFSNFKEYHTSLDNFNFVKEDSLNKSLKFLISTINNFQKKMFPKSSYYCEPFLTKKNLYKTLSFKIYYKKDFSKKILDFLQYCDGKNSLEDISFFIKLNIKETKKIYKYLLKIKLVY